MATHVTTIFTTDEHVVSGKPGGGLAVADSVAREHKGLSARPHHVPRVRMAPCHGRRRSANLMRPAIKPETHGICPPMPHTYALGAEARRKP